MSHRRPIVKVLKAGLIPYINGLHLQKYLANQPADKVKDFNNFLVIQEHNPVYTIGIRTKDYSSQDEEKLKSLGAEFYKTNRGGLITFHGPGQLVAYPILHLQQFKPSMRWYVSNLEEAVIEICSRMGVKNAQRTNDTGIWIENKKICAIGVHGSRYITTHGIGLNCCTDLKWFEHITPCGLVGKGVTSLSEEMHRNVSVEETSKVLMDAFGDVFNCDVLEHDNAQTKDILLKSKSAIL